VRGAFLSFLGNVNGFSNKVALQIKLSSLWNA